MESIRTKLNQPKLIEQAGITASFYEFFFALKFAKIKQIKQIKRQQQIIKQQYSARLSSLAFFMPKKYIERIY